MGQPCLDKHLLYILRCHVNEYKWVTCLFINCSDPGLCVFMVMKNSLWNNWPVIHAWPLSLWSDAIMRRSHLDLRIHVLRIHRNTFIWWDRFSAVLCLTAVFFADTVRKTEALSEVLKIPGSIKCHGNGDKEHTSKYPWLVSPVNKVSSACVGVWESLCCWHQKKSTFTWVTHRIIALEYIWWNMVEYGIWYGGLVSK